MKKLLYAVAALVLLLLIVAVCCFKPLDSTPYKQTGFYKAEMAMLDSVIAVENSTMHAAVFDTVHVGWASVNLLPSFSTPIAIDAHRGGKHFEGVHDSIYVRAFVFKQGGKKVAYVSADLLIIPPSVSRMFDTMLVKQGFDQSNIYFTATHTHTSIGGWYNSVVGKIFAGKYDERVPAFIANQIATAIQAAEVNCSPTRIGFAAYPTRRLVFNRLITEMAHLPDSLGEVDSILRVVKFEKPTGEKAAIITFSAHNTVFHENLMRLSGDWCGLLMQKLNSGGKIGFASFSAGAVGSHGPCKVTDDQEAEAQYIANGVAAIVETGFDSIATNYVANLNMLHVPLYLREPNLRVSDAIVIRPWLFKKLFGDEETFINTLAVGDVVFAGTPCDFSGELVNELDSMAAGKSRRLIVTSFNGGYIGYITDSRRYRLNTYETRTMGWFGYGTGDYMSDIIGRLLLVK